MTLYTAVKGLTCKMHNFLKVTSLADFTPSVLCKQMAKYFCVRTNEHYNAWRAKMLLLIVFILSVSTSWSSDHAGIKALVCVDPLCVCFGVPQISVVELVSSLLSVFELYCAVRQSSS